MKTGLGVPEEFFLSRLEDGPAAAFDFLWRYTSIAWADGLSPRREGFTGVSALLFPLQSIRSGWGVMVSRAARKGLVWLVDWALGGRCGRCW